MTDQRSSNDLSPPLQAVLGSLNVNLEAELNRYRRNRLNHSSASANDLFAGLEDPVFDLDTLESTLAIPAVAIPTLPAREPASAPTAAPPALPRNKKIAQSEPERPKAEMPKASTPASSLTLGSASLTSAASGALAKASNKAPDATDASPATAASITPSGSYLESSEKLIESLTEVPEMPEPVDATFKPKRKTVSLLAGASLGLFGLVAGLGASYVMSDPALVQRLTQGFRREDGAIATAPEPTFDPPGPDLSEQEFVDIDIDNLSSLKMPQTTIDPALKPTSPAPLPPIVSTPSSQISGQQTQTAAAPPIETQAVAIPAGVTYYVTVPFSTEQGLLDIRQSVSEAFVRQFADGNRIQLAAFDNPTAAQAFVSEIKAKGVSAQIYGPTTE